jgi:hypothetical protein
LTPLRTARAPLSRRARVAVLPVLVESVECRRSIAAAAGAGTTGAQGGHIDLKEQSCNDHDGLNEFT